MALASLRVGWIEFKTTNELGNGWQIECVW